jgi:hypothetical protein
VSYSSCSIWGADQYMYIQTGIGADLNYSINPVGITIDPTSTDPDDYISAIRGNAEGPAL